MAWYFAYGSNMLAARLNARCPSARALDVLTVDGFDIAFDKIGMDGSGKATLVPSPGASVVGGLFAVDDAEMVLLDQIEGVGRGYDRIRVTVRTELQDAEAFSYIAPPAFRDAAIRPFDWYLGLVMAGAYERRLPPDWIRRLAGQPTIPDPDRTRPRQIEARALLAACPSEWRLG